jgi:hypothetical protein
MKMFKLMFKTVFVTVIVVVTVFVIIPLFTLITGSGVLAYIAGIL